MNLDVGNVGDVGNNTLKINMTVDSILSLRCVVESRKVIGFNAPDVHCGITVNVCQ